MVASRRLRWLSLFLALAGTVLALYGGAGLCFVLHLPERFAEGVGFWRAAAAEGGLFPSTVAPVEMPAWLGPLLVHFDRAVLIVWVAWGLGILLLLFAASRRLGSDSLPQPAAFTWRDALALLLLLAVLALGYSLRATFLLPAAGAGLPAAHYDEMVYLQATSLWTRGIPPYTGYFLAHPPGILIAMAPAVLGGAAWSGPALVLAGRWLQCGYGLLAVALLYGVGRQIGGRRSGLLAALVLAVDVQAVQVAPLETIVNLAALWALWLYVRAWKRPPGWGRWVLAAMAGAAAVAAALTKVPGAVTLGLLALLALLAWQWRDLLAGAAGAALAGLSAALLFAGRAPGAFWRQVVAFQMLRPQETAYGRNHLARMADYPESRLTFLLLASVLVVLTAALLVDAWRRLRRGTMRLAAGPAAWVLPLTAVVVALLVLFSYGRAYHARYYVQLIVFFALLVAAAVGTIAPRLSAWPRGARVLGGFVTLVGLLFFLPLLRQQTAAAGRAEIDRSYTVVGAALAEAVPPERAVLALDPGYPLMAGRPPARFPDGTYLVDGAGLMVYRALGIAYMGPRQVWETAGELSREINPRAVFHQPAAQDVVVTALYGAGTPPAAAVIDMRIAAEDLTPQTQEFLRTRGPQIAWEQYNAAFAVERVEALGHSGSGLVLWDFNMRTLGAQGEGPAALPGEPLDITTDSVLQVSLYWFAARTPTTTLHVALELRDGAGQTVARVVEPPHFGDPPTDRWETGWVYQDHHNMPLPPAVPSGSYRLCVTLYDPSLRPWDWVGVDGPSLPLGVVQVGP